jgi:hypothetical protein
MRRGLPLELTSRLRFDIALNQTWEDEGCDMNRVSDKPSVSAVRWVARVLGTIIAVLMLGEFVEGVTYWASNKPGPTVRDYLLPAAFLLIFVGCVVGWFKDLPAAVLILGAFLLILVTALAFPGELQKVYLFAIPALPGFLFLYAHLAGKKK